MIKLFIISKQVLGNLTDSTTMTLSPTTYDVLPCDLLLCSRVADKI